MHANQNELRKFYIVFIFALYHRDSSRILFGHDEKNISMVVEIYIFRFIIYCIIALVLGYITVYNTLVFGKHIDNGKKDGPFFDFFYIFKKIGLFSLVEILWKGVVSFIMLITGMSLILDKEYLPKKK